MKLYVDDLRRCPPGWTVARTITDAISRLRSGYIEEISLDHDIAFLRGTDIRMSKESFMPVVWYMALMPRDLMRPKRVRIHTANIDAGWKMAGILEASGYTELEVVMLGDEVLQEDVENFKKSL